MSAAMAMSMALDTMDMELEEEEFEDTTKNGRNTAEAGQGEDSLFRTKWTVEPIDSRRDVEKLRDSVASAEAAMKRFTEAGTLSSEAKHVNTLNRYLSKEPEEKYTLKWVRWKTAVVVESPNARIFIMVLVIINGLLIGLEADLVDPNETNAVFQMIELVCVAIFTVEVTLKLFGVGFRNFFYDSWNIVDSIIVAASLADLVVTETMGLDIPSLSALRLVRVLRVVRIVGMMERLAVLAQAFIVAMDQTMWVMALVMLIVYIFGVMGQGLFGDVPELAAAQAICQTSPCGVAGTCEYHYACFKDTFFRNVMRSMISLFQIMTLDDWAKITRPIGETLPWAWIFFTAFVLLGSLGLMNLITAVFIEALLEQTGAAAARKAEVKRRRAAKKVLIVEDTIRDFMGDNHGRLLDAPKLTTILNEVERHPYLVQAFEDVGAPIASLRLWMHLTEEDEHGNVDIPQLLTMVQTSNLPTLRRTIFELKYRVYEQETREDEEIVVLSNMVDQLTNVLGGLNRKVDALGASSASAGSTMSSVIYA